MVQVTITVTGGSIRERVSKNINATIEQVNQAVTAAMNMCRSMIAEHRPKLKSVARASSAAGGRTAFTLLSTTCASACLTIFPTPTSLRPAAQSLAPRCCGSLSETVHGQGNRLVSAKGTSKPLMLSITDKSPKLFGVSSVTIPKKWDLNGVVQNVMQNFADYFAEAMEQ